VLTRRRFLLGASAAAAGSAAAGAGLGRALASGGRLSMRQPAVPARQHAWDATLARDVNGNPIAPRR
jgi:hypothetical protein